MKQVLSTRIHRRAAVAATAAVGAASVLSPFLRTTSATAADSGFDSKRAVGQVDAVVADVMARSGVPGVAVAVIADGAVAHLAGYGVRDLDADEPVDTDTVFQLASVSKSLSGVAVANAVAAGVLNWEDPISTHLPAFALADGWVTAHATIADGFSHRTGLPPRAGDAHEALDYPLADIIRLLRAVPLAYDFRDGYAYTNFGLTVAGYAAAAAAGLDWPTFMATYLYDPVGMRDARSDTDVFLAQQNRAVPHVQDAAGAWIVSPNQRVPDRQSPAGGASATITDLARWATMVANAGVLDGAQVIPTDALAAVSMPLASPSYPTPFANRATFYGLGVGIEYNERGDVVLSHSGAFTNGAATCYSIIPARGFGVVALSNGFPIGAVESIAATLVDLAYNDSVTADWFADIGAQFAAAIGALATPPYSYADAPADAEPPRDLEVYAGVYANAVWDGAVVTLDGDALVMVLGPTPARPLDAWNGDTFVYRWVYEAAHMHLGVVFTLDPNGTVIGFTIPEFAADGSGVFTRVG